MENIVLSFFEQIAGIPTPKFQLFQPVSYTYTVTDEGNPEDSFIDLGVIVGISWDTHDRRWLYDVNFSPDFSLMTDIAMKESELEPTAIGVTAPEITPIVPVFAARPLVAA